MPKKPSFFDRVKGGWSSRGTKKSKEQNKPMLSSSDLSAFSFKHFLYKATGRWWMPSGSGDEEKLYLESSAYGKLDATVPLLNEHIFGTAEGGFTINPQNGDVELLVKCLRKLKIGKDRLKPGSMVYCMDAAAEDYKKHLAEEAKKTREKLGLAADVQTEIVSDATNAQDVLPNTEATETTVKTGQDIRPSVNQNSVSDDDFHDQINAVYLHILSQATGVSWQIGEKTDEDVVFSTNHDFAKNCGADYTQSDLDFICRRLNLAVYSYENEKYFYANGDKISINRSTLDFTSAQSDSLVAGKLVHIFSKSKEQRIDTLRKALGVSEDLSLAELFSAQVLASKESSDTANDDRQTQVTEEQSIPPASRTTPVALKC